MDKISTLVALGAAGGMLAVIVLLLVLWLKERKVRREAQRQLEVQKGRVMVRKHKIMELRGQLRQMHEQLQICEGKLLGSYTQEEIAASYRDVAEALRGVLGCAEAMERGTAVQGSLKGAAKELAARVKEAFHVSDDMQLEKHAEEKPDAEANGGIRGRVLVVDDNELNRELCVELMEVSGFLVDEAENGEEAVEKFRRSREGYYDVILMDVMMPVKNGYEACREIRKLFRSDSERVPVIAVTANNFAEDYVQLQDAGMNDRIVKPVNQDILLSMVNKWLHQEREGDEASMGTDGWRTLYSSAGGDAYDSNDR